MVASRQSLPIPIYKLYYNLVFIAIKYNLKRILKTQNMKEGTNWTGVWLKIRQKYSASSKKPSKQNGNDLTTLKEVRTLVGALTLSSGTWVMSAKKKTSSKMEWRNLKSIRCELHYERFR